MSATTAVRDGWREGTPAARSCVVCHAAMVSAKARYCSRACQQRAYRLRQAPAAAADAADLRQELVRRRRLVVHTIYECPVCGERFLGERRCGECHRFCRAVGLGGRCPDCDTLILVRDLLEEEV